MLCGAEKSRLYGKLPIVLWRKACLGGEGSTGENRFFGKYFAAVAE